MLHSKVFCRLDLINAAHWWRLIKDKVWGTKVFKIPLPDCAVQKANWLNVAIAAYLQHLSGEMRCSFLAAVLLQQGNLGKSRALCIMLTLVKKPLLGKNHHSMKALLGKRYSHGLAVKFDDNTSANPRGLIGLNILQALSALELGCSLAVGVCVCH